MNIDDYKTALGQLKRASCLSNHEPMSVACNCIGPQNGQPLCPCQMRSVQIKDGRYVRIQDLGPAPKC